ncbi:MAG: sulfatase-like hydrolase/transferase [Flavobacteriales bacterium]|nr:sulfatase-like hydrolase/transferase [Flavobacteriales bacterium]
MLKSIGRQHLFVLVFRLISVYFIYLLLRISFYLFNAAYFPEVGFTELLSYCFYGIRFDTTALLYINGLYLILFILPFRFRTNETYQKIASFIFILFNAIGIIANLVDFAYYPFILQRSTWIIFDFFELEDNASGILWSYLFEYWAVPLLAIFFIGLLYLINKRIKSTEDLPIKNSAVFVIINTVIMVLIVWLTIVAIRGGFDRTTRPITLSNAAKYVDKPHHTAIVLNTPFCLFRTIEIEEVERINFYSEKELESIYPVKKHYQDSVDFKSLNVVIFILESFGKECSGLLNPQLEDGTYQGFMPFLDSLMLQGRVFSNAYANGHKSIDAIPSVIAGIPSLVSPYILSHHSNNELKNSLPKLLKRKGYSSSFYHGAPNGSMGFDAFCNIAGFDEYYGLDEYLEEHEYAGSSWGIYDEEFLDYFLEDLNKKKEPFLSTIFTVSSHSPFKVPERYDGKLRTGKNELYRVIHYTDQSLRKFFKNARDQSWYKNTLFVFTADHTSMPTYPQYRNSAGGYAVPLLFYKEGLVAPQMDSTYAQQIDILPTVLNYLNYSEPFFAFGTNLNDTNDQHFSINYRSGNYQLFKNGYLLQYDMTKIQGLYNLENDKLLKSNLAATNDSIRQQAELHKFIQAVMQQYNNRLLENKFKLD